MGNGRILAVLTAMSLLSGCATAPTSPPVAVVTPAETPETKEAAPEIKNAQSLADEAKALVKQGSSQADLAKAVMLSNEAAALEPSDTAIALQHARHALAYTQTMTDIDQQAQIAEAGLRSMDASGLSGETLEPVAAYYRGALTGLVMQVQGLAAAGKLPELETLFKKSTQAPATESGGPWRALGMLYLKAPAWPTGIGDLELALENLEQATSSYPNHPYNHICLARALVEDGESERAAEELNEGETLLQSSAWGGLGAAWQQEIAEIRRSLN